MSSPSSSPVRRWQSLLIGLVTIGLVALFLRDMDLREAWNAAVHAHRGWLAAAAATTMMTYVLRAWRWRWILRPIGPARFRTAFRTTVMGFAASFLLPGRVGELLRPYALARQERLNPAAAMATIVVERVFDLCTVLVLFAVATLAGGVNVPREIETAGMLGAVAAVAGIAILFVVAGHPDRMGRWAGRLSAWLPTRVASVVDHLVRTFVQGLGVMRRPADLFWSFVWSVPLWLSIALGITLTSWAFGVSMSFTGSFLVVGYLTVGVAVPTPGAAGGFHYFYKLAATQLFNAPDSVAGAAAIVLHLVTFVPVTILGVIFMWQDGLTLGQVKSVRTTAPDTSESAAGREPAREQQVR